MLDFDDALGGLGAPCDFFGQGAGNRARRGETHGACHRMRLVARVGYEETRGNRAPLARPGQQADLGYYCFRYIAHTHHDAGLEADGFHAFEEILIGIEFIGGFITGFAERVRMHLDYRHRDIDAADFDAVDHVQRFAGRQQLSGDRADGALEIDAHGRGRAGHAVDGGLAFVHHFAAGGLHNCFYYRLRIDVENAHRRLALLRRNQSGIDGEWPDGDQHVAAIGFGVDALLVDFDLREQIIHVHAGTLRFADHRHLARH